MSYCFAESISKTRRNGRIIICGPSRDSVSGVATHLNQLFRSSLAQDYSLLQFQVGSEGRNEVLLRKIFRYLTSPMSLAATIIRFKPNILHLNSSLEVKAYWRDLVYLIIARMLRCSVVFQVHGGEIPCRFLGRNRWAQKFLRWSLDLPDALVLLAEVERKSYQEFSVGKRVFVIPNAIDLEEYRFKLPKVFNSDVLRLGYIGRIAADKGIREVIEAMNILKKQGMTKLQLTVAGSGPFEAELVAMVAELGMGENVKFVGAVFGEQKLLFWNSIDVFIFPTYHREGLPYTVLEALASGTPQITTPVGGIPDAINNGVEGLIVASHEPQLIADGISELLGDTERLRNMSKAALKRACEHYSIVRLARQFDDLYQELLV